MMESGWGLGYLLLEPSSTHLAANGSLLDVLRDTLADPITGAVYSYC